MSIALKFTSLFIRTLAKPIANQIKSHARDHPTFRKRCIKVAQAIYRTESGLRTHLLNENKKKIKPLNDARAIETGATFVAEGFVFSVAGSMICYESWRSRQKQQKQQASVADDIKILQGEIVWLKNKMEESTIIKKGENVPFPEGLKPAILKLIAEHQDTETSGTG